MEPNFSIINSFKTIFSRENLGKEAAKEHIKNTAQFAIKLKGQRTADGFFILASHGQTTRLPNNTYIVDKQHLKLLKKARIPYEVL